MFNFISLYNSINLSIFRDSIIWRMPSKALENIKFIFNSMSAATHSYLDAFPAGRYSQIIGYSTGVLGVVAIVWGMKNAYSPTIDPKHTQKQEEDELERQEWEQARKKTSPIDKSPPKTQEDLNSRIKNRQGFSTSVSCDNSDLEEAIESAAAPFNNAKLDALPQQSDDKIVIEKAEPKEIPIAPALKPLKKDQNPVTIINNEGLIKAITKLKSPEVNKKSKGPKHNYNTDMIEKERLKQNNVSSETEKGDSFQDE